MASSRISHPSLVQQLQNTAVGGVTACENTVAAVGCAVTQTGHALVSAFERAVDAPPKWVRAVQASLDFPSALPLLSQGDSYQANVSASISYPGLKALGHGMLDVRRTPEGFVLGATGEVFGGLFGMVGGTRGKAAAGLEGLVAPGAGGRLEWTFKRLGDAQRAAVILEKEARAATFCAPLLEAPLVLSALVHGGHLLSASDSRFLRSHLSAMELRGSGLADLKGRLGLGNTRTSLAGLFSGTSVRQDEALRLEWPAGKSPEVIFKQTSTLDGSTSSSLLAVHNGGSGKGGSGGSRTGAGVLMHATVVLERRFAAERLTPQGFRLTVTRQVGAHAFQNGKGLQDKLTVAGRRAPSLASVASASGKVLKGAGLAVASAQSRSPESATVDFIRQPFSQVGFGLSPELRVMGLGGGVDVQAARLQMHAPVVEFHVKKSP